MMTQRGAARLRVRIRRNPAQPAEPELVRTSVGIELKHPRGVIIFWLIVQDEHDLRNTRQYPHELF